ncbi:hypothetical protein [Actinokineospora fastidiosa]|uniref:Uncharacterized protein n=1 Tax=Actinokineospora fastidiosa TaxID=1816 RepID=A0A918LAD7_9PSEU|nr:hypothetical protein [Actinokineospora fastidiosa]GGS24990.1 hypothetical protein GCM10010171_17760 [Actinokineospora fastidiosa]
MRTALATWNRPFIIFTVAMAAVAAVSVGGLILDDRVLVGAPIWLKPLKFALSFMLYGVAWAWLIALMPKRSRTLQAASAVIILTSIVEMAILLTQTVRGRESHFNSTTETDAMLFELMGITIAVFWVATLVGSVVIGARRIAPRPENLAIRLGLGISLVGMLLGIPMTTRDSMREGFSGTHSVGVVEGGPGMPLTAWSTTGGDLRIPHFVGLHALQVLPLIALALTVLAARYAVLRAEEVRYRMVWTAGVVYAGLIALVTWQAFRGQPLLRPDWLTLAALAVLIGAGAAGVSWAKAGRKELVTA